MKKLSKLFFLTGAIAVMSFSAFTVYAGPADNTQVNVVIIDSSKNGWEQIGGNWFFYENGQMRTGWMDWNGNRYYMNADGKMASGECIVNGKSYTFSADGSLLFEGIHREGMEDDLISAAWESYASLLPEIQDMINRINQTRAAAGAGPLVLDEDLCIVAMYRSLHMYKYNYCGHFYNNVKMGKDSYQRYTGADIIMGENVQSLGRSNPSSNRNYISANGIAMNGFINSPSHYKAMINTRYNKVGVGMFYSADGMDYYVTQLFGV